MNDSNYIRPSARAAVHGSRWLAAAFASIVIVSGMFAGCADVGVDPVSCDKCNIPAVQFDTSVTDFKFAFDTVWNRYTYDVTIKHRTDTLLTNLATGDTVHFRGTFEEKITGQPREPILEATIYLKDKDGNQQKVDIRLKHPPLDVAVGENGVPTQLAFSTTLELREFLDRQRFGDRFGSLTISLPRSSYDQPGKKFYLDQSPGFGPYASLQLTDSRPPLVTGGTGKTVASLTITNLGPRAADALRRRIMELDFIGLFDLETGGPNDVIGIGIHFRLSY